MKRITWIIGTCALSLYSFVSLSQSPMPSISEMKWGRDYNLHVKLSNDTNYVMDVRGLYHTADLSLDIDKENTTYYPVSLDEEFINYIKQRKLESDTRTETDSLTGQEPNTLWSALHRTLGGGYVHFINCLIYSLESQQLNLTDPMMVRPVSDWKPKPRTETYKRTRKWVHYIPFDQKLAIKEYKKRQKGTELRDLQGVPDRFIEFFLSTSQKDYERLRREGRYATVAQIDLVRLLLGAKYLGKDQINFIQSQVTTAVLRYSISNLPSIIIFDDYNAAVAMTLDKSGYKIDYVVFRDFDSISDEENRQRLEKVEALIETINEANERVFQKRLSTYYGR